MSNLYHLFGLAVRSDFELPELAEIAPADRVRRRLSEIEIVEGPVRRELPNGRHLNSRMQYAPRVCLYEYEGLFRILVEDGERITIDLSLSARESEMRAFLFSSGMGSLLHMRNLIPLHISAVIYNDDVWAFSGPSGSGKSTTAANLHFKNGYTIFCDDVAVLDPIQDDPILYRGTNRLRLWKDVLEKLPVDIKRAERDVWRFDKFSVVDGDLFLQNSGILKRLTMLSSRNHIDKKGLSQPVKNFESLLASIYRPRLATIFNDRKSIVRSLARWCRKIEIIDKEKENFTYTT